jgi:hypothetical protein
VCIYNSGQPYIYPISLMLHNVACLLVLREQFAAISRRKQNRARWDLFYRARTPLSTALVVQAPSFPRACICTHFWHDTHSPAQAFATSDTTHIPPRKHLPTLLTRHSHIHALLGFRQASIQPSGTVSFFCLPVYSLCFNQQGWPKPYIHPLHDRMNYVR